MQMDDYEILKSWNNAADQKAQVEILADLNAVSKTAMREKLVELGAEGVPPAPQKRQREKKTEGRKRATVMDELRAMDMYRSGACDLEIADALGVTKPTVCSWRKRMRLTPHPQKKRCTGLDDNRAWTLYNEGLCDLDMAEALGVSRNTVAAWRKKHDLKCHRQAPGYVQKRETLVGTDDPSVSCADSSLCTREPLDRTGQGGACPVGKEEPVEKNEYMGVEGLLRVTQRMQEAFPQARVTACGLRVRDVRVHIWYGADGEAGKAEMELILEEEQV